VRVVGLTGGIGSGKSTFAAALRARGVPVLDADALARAAVAPGSPALAEIARAFGSGVLTPDGALDRARVAAIVFADPEARRRLEAITHPAVRRAMLEETARLVAAGHALAFYDVPLLYEKARRADFVVDNAGPPEALGEKADRLLADLQKGAGRRLPNAPPLRY
jgi:dephospho-CoA kinase